MSQPVRRALVVGCGVNGLRTALELARKNVKVTLKSACHPLHPSVCSVGAGGFWMPFRCPDKRVDNWAIQTLDELLQHVSNKKNSLVELVPAINLKRETTPQNELPPWTKDCRLAFQLLTVDMLEWQNRVHDLRLPSIQTLKDSGYHYMWFFNSPVVDTSKMLLTLLNELKDHKNTIDIDLSKKYASLDEMKFDAIELNCDAIVNCTGMGSKILCGDDDLKGGRGVTLLYDRHNSRYRQDMSNTKDAVITTEEPPWGSEIAPAYAIARGEHYVVGGSYLENDDCNMVRDEEKARLKCNAKHLLSIEEDEEAVAEWTGFRPVRSTVRVELDKDQTDIDFVHNYGHGGSGWTTFVGTSLEVTRLLRLE